MARDIPVERIAEMVAKRLPCPVKGCGGVVRLNPGMAPGGGDVPVWACSVDLCHQWSEDGKPRWTVVDVLDIEIEEAE